ncbi:class I SAM-dependent methyltransferase [Nakamurella sp. GG22]
MTARAADLSVDWLTLREPADAQARSVDLVERVRRWLPPDRPTVIHDLGCGTGSMGRWLAPQLSGRQHWMLYDREPGFLSVAASGLPTTGPAGEQISSETRLEDITRLDDGRLAGASLITASALLDMLTADELDRIVAACVRAGCPVLLTLSVTGRVELAPPDTLDGAIVAAFNAHQRRDTESGTLLGPDAVLMAAESFERAGATVIDRDTPWRLDASHAPLLAEWFAGWVRAACEQEPSLTAAATDYAGRRAAEAADGALLATVWHRDLLVLPTGDGWSAAADSPGEEPAR